MLVYQLPKAKTNTHPSTHSQSRTLSTATSLPTTFASSTIHFDTRLLTTFFSALHNISRPAFLATSFTLLLRSIASQRNSLHACIANPPPPTTFYQQHINLLSSDIGVLGSPKIRLGYIGGDTKGSSWYRTTRHQQQSNLPYSGSHTFFLRTSSTCTTINWAYFRKLGVSGQRPSHSLSLAGTGLVGNIRRCHRRRR
jgi:hypothetical protein